MDMEWKCDPCQIYEQKLHFFKFFLNDDMDFNHTVYVYIFYIGGKPVFHVVCKETTFQSEKWLKDMTS